MAEKNTCTFENIEDGNNMFDHVSYEIMQEETAILDLEPSKVFDLSPFNQKQVKYLKGLVDSDNSLDDQFRDSILSVLDGFLEGFAYHNHDK